MIKYSFILLFVAGFLVFCVENYNTSKSTLVKVKIVNVIDKSAWWFCGDSGYTVVELENRVRKTICEQYGPIGDEMLIPADIFN